MDKNILKEFLPNDPIILDAGAFNGNDSIDFAIKFPESIIHSFEPVSNIFDELVVNVQDYNNIICYNMALDCNTGSKDMFISSGYSNQSSSLMKPYKHLEVFPDCKFDKIQTVNTITINDFVEKFHINRIDMMWLDLQGNEFRVLCKANKIINTVKCIYAEYSLLKYYEGLILYDDFVLFMESLGFYEKYRYGQYDYLGCGNALFLKGEKNIND